jgi:hypothetical protein
MGGARAAAPTVGERHPEFLQVLLVELRQDVEADVVFLKRLRVLSQTLPFQPLGDPGPCPL